MSRKYLDDTGLSYFWNKVNSKKQETLVSGTNIKTINNQSLLGNGNISISGGTTTDVQVNGSSIVSNNTANLVTNTAYNASTNKLATMSDLPDTSNFLEKAVQGTGYYSDYTGTIENSATGIDMEFSSSDYSKPYAACNVSTGNVLINQSTNSYGNSLEMSENGTFIYQNGSDVYNNIEMNNSGIEIFSFDDNNDTTSSIALNSSGTTITNVVTPTTNDMAANKAYVDTGLSGKQATLVSGTNIKTINNESILGSGNITISGGGSSTWGSITGTLSNQTDLNTALTGKQSKFWEGTLAQYNAIATKDPDTYYAITDDADMTQYQPLLVSGTNIKTINNESLLGSGNISIPTNTITSTAITSVEKLTQAEYTALSTKDSNTLYIIVG